VRHAGRLVVRLIGVPQAGQHVRDRIGHGHDVWFFFLATVSAISRTFSGL
jgi:hypothetical protein